ncbi:hypothetical protein J2Z31_002671 [Sinorhizobium kostiense]|uniref:GP-PDE domain-containing protein n=1 Tax=Sinorhizobium kostiense TaxID=76747 RepID=A0ABS4QZU1_9HYPH|nr:glycerophosphodiester phosphodiesterase family protein [Sinorhizobium kostiense]MBP2236157.1 hypothetical protein [Sinorhizobium kostiense]
MATPIIIAHGGASLRQKPNTLASFRSAKMAGADALEVDLWLTAEGEVVCRHDSGLMIEGVRRDISSLRLETLANHIRDLATLEDAVRVGLPVYLDIKETEKDRRRSVLERALSLAPACRYIVGVIGQEDDHLFRNEFPDIHQLGLMNDDAELNNFIRSRHNAWIRLHQPRATPERVERFKMTGCRIMVTCGADATRRGELVLDDIPSLTCIRPDAIVVNDPQFALRAFLRPSPSEGLEHEID